ncbi:YkyB family protein [Anoxybacillus sp. J5B_2022]|uniref:YkyB family protein n=1 Tax=Anoxybacillus sp. J5B_2022 TaxID=3003246 RepID=UPI002286BFA1|nr:YkyB family protein [Anoxybacillus sp. J5B_2022]MCZ0754275.1 YkyB family protein [Anoxybacillus sp. J5B_2022]
MERLEPTIDNLAKAIFTVNRHAKTALNPSFLYLLKKKTIEKLLDEGKAKKVGLHFSPNPKYSQQQSDVLVVVGEYYFHIPPTKEDFATLPHLGALNGSYRNPVVKMPLSKAKALLQSYTGITETEKHPPRTKKPYQKPIFKRLGER